MSFWIQRSAACIDLPKQRTDLCVIPRLCMHAQSCPALCDPLDCNPPGSSVHGVSRQKYWSELPFPSPGDLPHPGTEPSSPALAGGFCYH